MNFNHLKKYICEYIFSVAAIGVFSFGGYARIWEHRQPKEEIKDVVIGQIAPYSNSNELHWYSSGMKVHIQGREISIDFPAKNWNDAVKEGDTVDMVVRKSFFGEDLDGLSINK